jgi:hypothetical protein
MNKYYVRYCTSIIIILSISSTVVFAERRANPYPEEYFTDKCQYIFVGKVLEVNEHEMPILTQVLLSIKGNMPNGENNIITKNPGRYAIFKEEFDNAQLGDIGIFFLLKQKGQSQPILWKYKTIPYIKENSKNDKN